MRAASFFDVADKSGRLREIEAKRFAQKLFARFEVVGEGPERNPGALSDPAKGDRVRTAVGHDSQRSFQDFGTSRFGRRIFVLEQHCVPLYKKVCSYVKHTRHERAPGAR